MTRATALAHRARLLETAGLGLLSAAAGVLHLAAGLAVGGVSLLVLAWLLEPDDGPR
ncbi:hypothetical protein [Streptomyces sp. NPDC002889]|uniref:hypothetical protein n=1 Tax=Streptomyces sp. NPDC002889 TaxID=3364669 RepID=UPI0036C29B24